VKEVIRCAHVQARNTCKRETRFNQQGVEPLLTALPTMVTSKLCFATFQASFASWTSGCWCTKKSPDRRGREKGLIGLLPGKHLFGWTHLRFSTLIHTHNCGDEACTKPRAFAQFCKRL
jgi:hypothetical protein